MRKNCESILTYVFLIYCIFSIPSVSGHSPLISGDTGKLDEAMFINDPIKSWAIYGELHEGREAYYYRFEIERGQRIHISLMKPTGPEYEGFMPGFVLMGTGLNDSGNIPDYVEKPALAKGIVIPGVQPVKASYEPFAPSSFYSLAELDILAPVSGSYYVAVYEPDRGGHYSLAIGEREVYSLAEWILIPVSLISIYQWEGQSLFIIFLPIIAALASGLLILRRKKWMPLSLFEWTGILAGLLFLATGFMVLFQMAMALTTTPFVPEIAITIIMALLPILFGMAVMRIIIKNREEAGIMKRIYLVILGIFALLIWAGFIIGPVLAVLASLIPAPKTGLRRE